MNVFSPQFKPRLLVGPMFLRNTDDVGTCIAPGIVPVGVTLEMPTADLPFIAPLYRKFYSPERCELLDLLIEANNVPFNFSYLPCFAVETQERRFLPFESFLVGLFQAYDVQRTIFAIFKDLRDVIPFSRRFKSSFQPLTPAAAAIGFAVANIFPYGRSVLVDVDWVAPEDTRTVPSHLSVDSTAIDFRPRPDGTLNEGKWHQPNDSLVRTLLNRELRKVISGPAINLSTDAGKEEVLSRFEWTPLARMASRQARDARVQFILDHPELALDAYDLAEAMLKANLYSDSSSVSNIRKSLPPLIAEAIAKKAGF